MATSWHPSGCGTPHRRHRKVSGCGRGWYLRLQLRVGLPPTGPTLLGGDVDTVCCLAVARFNPRRGAGIHPWPTPLGQVQHQRRRLALPCVAFDVLCAAAASARHAAGRDQTARSLTARVR